MNNLMTTEMFSRVAAVIFTLGALAQLSRAIMGFDMVAGGIMVPIWLSWFAFLLLAILAYVGFTAKQS
jgi:hypothetical protein